MTTSVEQQFTTFKYENPGEFDTPKKSMRLARTDLLGMGIQVVKDGGETNLHAHSNQDAIWFVLGGRAKFYGQGDVVVADIGKHEGLVIPRGVPYWFESASEEPLEIIRFSANDPSIKAERLNFEELKDWQQERGLGGRMVAQ